MKRKFELFYGYLGNGTTVCNKAVEENGDYKKNRPYFRGWKHPAICCRVIYPSRRDGKNQGDGE